MRHAWLVMGAVVVIGAATPVVAQSNAELALQVERAETAFAATMASRDFRAFETFLADEAVFYGAAPQRGKAAIMTAWKKFYDAPAAPFSWKPTNVQVLDSGTLALSTGPVFDPDGKQTGVFNSIWRRGADGQWRVVFDKGCQVCNCAKAP
jgi:ketosteroid isomerase-like protein